MAKYAQGTDVPTERTQAQIVELLKKRGATDRMMGHVNGRDVMAFVYEGVPVRLAIPQPERRDYNTDLQYEQEGWRRWRVMLIWIKGQLEMIDSGIMTPAEAFMPYLQLKDGRTAGEAMAEEGGRVIGHALALPPPDK